MVAILTAPQARMAAMGMKTPTVPESMVSSGRTVRHRAWYQDQATSGFGGDQRRAARPGWTGRSGPAHRGERNRVEPGRLGANGGVEDGLAAHQHGEPRERGRHLEGVAAGRL